MHAIDRDVRLKAMTFVRALRHCDGGVSRA